MATESLDDRLARLADTRASASDRLAPPSHLRGAPDGPMATNPTVWLAIVALCLWVIGIAGYLTGSLPAWMSVPTTAVGTYMGFTVFHESCHRTAHTNRRVNDALGWLPALVLGFVYPVFRSAHLQHHAHTNDHEFDPDHFVARDPSWLLPLWLLGTARWYRVLAHRHGWSTPGWRRVQAALDIGVLVAVVGTLATDTFTAFAVVWLVPTLIAGMFLFWAFDYLPHHPHDSTERFQDTRIQPGRIRHALLLAQNYHLIHHLWVSVPWFRYRQVYRSLEPELAKRNIRIG